LPTPFANAAATVWQLRLPTLPRTSNSTTDEAADATALSICRRHCTHHCRRGLHR
jgi:Holliday junction resolvasome RuvABC endonuclease subunit